MVDRNGRWRRSGVVLGTIWSRGTGRYSLIVLGSWMVVALVSLFWTPQSLLATDGYHVWDKPSSAHWLGTDGTGADVLSWLMAGSRTNLAIALLTVVCSAAIGILLVGLMVARSSALASASVAVVDALISIPTVLIALLLAVPFGASAAVVIGACSIGYGLHLARVARRPPCSPPARDTCSRPGRTVPAGSAYWSDTSCRTSRRC